MILTRTAILLLSAGIAVSLLAGALPWGWTIVVLFDAVTVALILADARLAGRARGRILARREHHGVAGFGRGHEVVLRVTNGGWGAVSLRVADALPESFRPAEAVFEPFELPPGKERELRYTTAPQRRGSFRLGPAAARLRGPLRLVERQFELVPATDVKVYPDLAPALRYQQLIHRSRLREYGVTPAPFIGQGTSFESLREFVPGDDPSKIEWKVSAKRGKLIVRNFQAERNQVVSLLVDAGKMMTTVIDGKSRLDYAVDAALVLGQVVLSRGDFAGAVLFADRVRKVVPPRKGAAQMKRIAESLYDAAPALVEPDYLRAFRAAAALRKRSLMVLFTDCLGPDAAAELIASTRALMPRHLPLLVLMKDRVLEEIAAGKEPAAAGERGLRMAAACHLLQERSETISHLRRSGAIALDLYPHQVTAGVIRKYLEIKLRNLI